jgi:CRISPR-associated endonuclease/helicase Cas3
MPENEVICFHSRFVATDRAEIEKNLLARVGKDSESADRNGLIVVGTQVLEQSLDLDFDFMVTQLAPMDLLLQRCGRLHRHNRKRPEKLEKAEFSILQPTEDKSDSIYSKWILMRTSKYLPDKLVIPTCIPKLVNLVYSDPQNDDEKTSDEWSLHQRIRSDKKIKAGKFCINSDYLLYKRKKALSDFLDDDAGNSNEAEASVRDGDESIEVLVMQRKADGNYYFLPWYNGGVLVDKSLVPSEEESKAIARQRIRLPLSLSKYDFKKMIDELTAMPSRWRESHWLKGEMLLLLDENLQTNIKGRRLIYSRETGLEQE